MYMVGSVTPPGRVLSHPHLALQGPPVCVWTSAWWEGRVPVVGAG